MRMLVEMLARGVFERNPQDQVILLESLESDFTGAESIPSFLAPSKRPMLLGLLFTRT